MKIQDFIKILEDIDAIDIEGAYTIDGLLDKIDSQKQIDDLRDELRDKECHISGLLAENTLLRDQLDLFNKDLAVYEKDQIRKGKVTDVLVEYRKENEELKQLVETKDKAFDAQAKFKFKLLEDNSDKKMTIRRLERLNTEMWKEKEELKEKIKELQEKKEQVSFTGMLDMQKTINKLRRKNKKAGKMIGNQKQQIHEERKENLENSRIIRSVRDELFGPQIVIHTSTYGYKEEKKRIIEKIKDLKEKAYMNDATYRYMTDLETKNRELKIENMRLKEGKFPIRL